MSKQLAFRRIRLGLPLPRLASPRVLAGAIALLFAFGALVAVHGEAQAEKRIAVLPFTGPKAAKFEKMILPLAKRTSKVLPGNRYKRATKKIRRFKPNRKNLKTLSKRLGLDGYVKGTVQRRKGRFRLSITILDADGRPVGDEITLVSKNPRLSPRQKKKLQRNLADAFDRLDGGSGSSSRDDEDEDEDEVEDTREDEDEDEDTGRGANEDEDEDRGSSDEEDTSARDSDEDSKGGDSEDPVKLRKDDDDPSQALPLRSRPLEVSGGLSFNQRSLTFTADNVGVDPQGYRGSMVPGAFVDINIFPMAFTGKSGVLGSIGITANFDQVLKLESTLEGMEDVVLPTTQRRFGFGLMYRLNLSPEKDRGISVRVRANYSALNFDIDKSMAPAVTIPSAQYSFYEPGVDVDIPVGEKINVRVGGAFYVITSTGEMQAADTYGGATVSGYDARVGASYALTKQIAAQLGARYATIGHTFDGSGDLTDRDDNDQQDVSAASDTYISLFATVGYLY